ncbi:hypothetical protein [Methylobacterium flocculans]|nr:hypothetical protein [Methylobacterium sp. FF17]
MFDKADAVVVQNGFGVLTATASGTHEFGSLKIRWVEEARSNERCATQD